jgi:hypothetical protein
MLERKRRPYNKYRKGVSRRASCRREEDKGRGFQLGSVLRINTRVIYVAIRALRQINLPPNLTNQGIRSLLQPACTGVRGTVEIYEFGILPCVIESVVVDIIT